MLIIFSLVFAIILSDAFQSRHIFIGDGEVQLDVGADMLRIGRLGKGNGSQLERILNAQLRDGSIVLCSHLGQLLVFQRCAVSMCL